MKEPDILCKTQSPRLILPEIKKKLQMNFAEKTKHAFHVKYISPRIVSFTKELRKIRQSLTEYRCSNNTQRGLDLHVGKLEQKYIQ